MSSGKKGKRTKGKTLALSTFLGEQKNAPHGYTVCNIDWAEAMEKEELDDKMDMKQLVLPTAPKAARGLDIDMDDIPTKPPFTAYVGNLPYEVTEEDITRFFRDLKVSSVRIPRESGDKGRIRGFGYAEFADRQSLIQALEKNNETMKNRSLKVSLATEHNKDDGDRKDERSDRTVGDWRAGPREDSFQGSRGDGYDRGTSDRDSYQGRSSYSNGRYERSDRGHSNDRDFDRGYGGDWGGERRQGGDRYGDRDRYGERDRFGGDRGGFDDRDRGYDRGSRGGGRREYFNRDRDGGRDGGFERRRDDFSRDQGSFERRTENRDEMDAPKERPKLQLKPRTVAKEPSDAGNVSSSSIFGGAKPVDTAAREREIEDRLAKERQDHEKGTAGDRKAEPRKTGPPRSRQSSESSQPSSFRNSLSEDDSVPPTKIQQRNNDERQSSARPQAKSWAGDKEAPSDAPREGRPPAWQRKDDDSKNMPQDPHNYTKPRSDRHTNGSLPKESAARRARNEGEKPLDSFEPVEYHNKYSQLGADEDEMHEGSASD